ncbi:MAG: hypothetical protein IJ004_06245 [Clostridia bacterium]|nr:hypothetical protein [Clostridia bacterium]
MDSDAIGLTIFAIAFVLFCIIGVIIGAIRSSDIPKENFSTNKNSQGTANTDKKIELPDDEKEKITRAIKRAIYLAEQFDATGMLVLNQDTLSYDVGNLAVADLPNEVLDAAIFFYITGVYNVLYANFTKQNPEIETEDDLDNSNEWKKIKISAIGHIYENPPKTGEDLLEYSKMILKSVFNYVEEEDEYKEYLKDGTDDDDEEICIIPTQKLQSINSIVQFENMACEIAIEKNLLHNFQKHKMMMLAHLGKLIENHCKITEESKVALANYYIYGIVDEVVDRFCRENPKEIYTSSEKYQIYESLALSVIMGFPPEAESNEEYVSLVLEIFECKTKESVFTTAKKYGREVPEDFFY